MHAIVLKLHASSRFLVHALSPHAFLVTDLEEMLLLEPVVLRSLWVWMTVGVARCVDVQILGALALVRQESAVNCKVAS